MVTVSFAIVVRATVSIVLMTDLMIFSLNVDVLKGNDWPGECQGHKREKDGTWQPSYQPSAFFVGNTKSYNFADMHNDYGRERHLIRYYYFKVDK